MCSICEFIERHEIELDLEDQLMELRAEHEALIDSQIDLLGQHLALASTTRTLLPNHEEVEQRLLTLTVLRAQREALRATFH